MSNQWTAALTRAFDDHGGIATVGCPAAPASHSGDLIAQEVAHDGQPNGAIVVVADDPTRAWWFNRALWGSYHGLRDQAVAFIGTPTAVRHEDGGEVQVDLSTGGVLVAERDDAPYFLVSQFHVTWWHSHPELGRPTRQPDAREGRQDFERGYGQVLSGDLTHPEARAVAEPGKELPPGPLTGRIIEQGDHTSWWITPAGKRQWIPDVATWTCLGGTDRVLEPKTVPGYATASIPYDGIARCPTVGR